MKYLYLSGVFDLLSQFTDYTPPLPIETFPAPLRSIEGKEDPQKVDEVPSMSPEQASDRLIRPEEQVYSGGGSGLEAVSASMFEHVPSSKLIGMDDFVDEAQYYDKYQKLMPKVGKRQKRLNFFAIISSLSFHFFDFERAF